ncbi:CAP domain-containing protein, partial [Streptomyces sp. NPDC000410]|uniref:CAP domain-containing protein n=1 Tax=Streptomyces sp. NPDC000410 TaxID=3154254 RepID=UPI0033344832
KPKQHPHKHDPHKPKQHPHKHDPHKPKQHPHKHDPHKPKQHPHKPWKKQPPRPPQSPLRPPSFTVQQVVDLVNAERDKAGCGPVRGNHKLARAARSHSTDMAARRYFDHTNPDGADPGDRIDAADYQWRRYGENIARGQQTPISVMDAWMNSPGHRANILNCAFKEIGVGVHHAVGGPWWTQAFGTAL